MTQSSLTNGVQLTSDSSVRTSVVDRFIVHHAATTSLAAILSLFQPGGREVSANYAMGTDGTLVLAVDENRRAWTSASSYWDNRAITIEVADSYAGDPWPVSDASFDKLARLIADVSVRYGFPINDDTVLTHQELYTRYGDSYATACPGDLQRRKAELLASANKYRTSITAGGGFTPIKKEIRVKQYHFADRSGFSIAPGFRNYLHNSTGAHQSVAGIVGPYSFVPHIYAEGTPGDVVELSLMWQDTKLPTTDPGRNSYHYVERLVLDASGKIQHSAAFQRAVASGFAVFVSVNAPASNKAPVKITVLDCDSWVFSVA